MKTIQAVVSAYKRAWTIKISITAAVLAFQLIAFGLLTPALGLLTNLAVSLSSQSALTDQDIARFLLTPVGGVAVLAVLSFMILTSVLGFTLITVLIHNEIPGVWRALRVGVMALIGRLKPLFIYSALLIIRVTAIAAPFVITGLFIAQRYLTEFDINYYLSARPPEFLLAASLIAAIVIALIIILLNRLLAWAVSLHLVLFDGASPNKAFSASTQLMTGHRLPLLKQVVAWLALYLAAASLLTVVAGLAFRLISNETESLQSILLVVVLSVSLWSLAGIILTSLSNGALAFLLYDLFDPDREHRLTRSQQMPQSVSLRWVAIAILGASALGIVSGMALIDRIKTSDTVLIIAHRGAAGDRPENTMASVHKAIEDGADWVEIDVQETADNQVVVVHDSDFMKLSQVDLKVWDATMDDLANIDIGTWFDAQYAQERTPLLRDVLDAAKGKSKVLIELKYYGHDIDLENRVISIVEETDMVQDIATMSLKYPAVEKMKELRPDWSAGVLAATAIGNLARLNADFVAVSGASVSQSLIDNVHAQGKDIYVWTINDPLDMSKMMSRGVDGIITDEPALARHVLEIRAELSTAERFLLLLADVVGVQMNQENYRDASP
ncbi:MAG: glycerophosphodiester phosphodiesterase [Paracoccaceae bacterium]